MELTQQQALQVGAGIATKNIIDALSIAVQVYEGGSLIIAASQPSIIQSTQIYASFGQKLGEELFNITHPNPLGIMIYYESDFA